MDSEKHYWFRLRTSGIGWTPASWKGWFVVALGVIIIVATVKYAFMGGSSMGSDLFVFVKLILLWSVLFLIILWKRIEPPHFFHKRGKADEL